MQNSPTIPAPSATPRVQKFPPQPPQSPQPLHASPPSNPLRLPHLHRFKIRQPSPRPIPQSRAVKTAITLSIINVHYQSSIHPPQSLPFRIKLKKGLFQTSDYTELQPVQSDNKVIGITENVAHLCCACCRHTPTHPLFSLLDDFQAHLLALKHIASISTH